MMEGRRVQCLLVGREDRVGGTLGGIATIPLANARTAGVGENGTAELLEGLELTIAGNGGANLLGTGGDDESGLGLEAVVESVTGDGSSAGHILVGGVGARADKTDLELLGPVVLLGSLGELGDGGSKIGGEGTVDVGLELAQVDLDVLVVLSTLIGAELLLVDLGELGNLGTLGGDEVVEHGLVVGEDGGGGTNLSTHVTCSLVSIVISGYVVGDTKSFRGERKLSSSHRQPARKKRGYEPQVALPVQLKASAPSPVSLLA